MGFLDKAVKAAATAKGQIDEVRDLRAQTSVKPIQARPFSDHEEDVLESVLRRGGPDPRVLLTAAEASEAAGQVLGGPHLTYGDDFIGVRYEAAGSGGRHWRVSVSAFHSADGRPFDAGAHWFGFLGELVSDDGVPVAGLGEVAVQRDADLYVLADPLLLMVEVSTPGGAGAADAERMQRVARAVLGRLL